MKRYIRIGIIMILAALSVSVFSSNTTTALSAQTKDTPDSSEQILLDKDNVKILADGLRESPICNGRELVLAVENSTLKDLTFQILSISINDVMLDVTFSRDASAGETINDVIYLPQSSLDYRYIKAIEKIELYLSVFDSSTGKNYFGDYITSLSYYPSNDVSDKIEPTRDSFDDLGQVMVEDNGVKITTLGTIERNECVEILLKIENKSKHPITVQINGAVINGKVLESLYLSNAPTNKTVYNSEVIPLFVLYSTDIDCIESVGLAFKLTNTETQEEIFKSDMIFIEQMYL